MNCNQCSAQNPRFHCGKCNSVQYCSKECQIKNWSLHKTSCKKSEPVKASPASSSTVDDKASDSDRMIEIVVVEGDIAITEKISEKEFNGPGWEKCIVPEMIGLPLKVKRLPRKQYQRPNREVAIFMMVEPVTGLAAPKWQTGCGIVAFAREDKSNFTVDLFWDLYSYIYHLMDFYGEDDFNYQQFKKERLNEKAFKYYQKQEHQIQENYQRQLAQFGFEQ